ncbi:MAG: acetylglutamate kinase [Actinobacteria bacterium]|nr:MAG: acetylglutamate kinase [Actinomycetota bacterium]
MEKAIEKAKILMQALPYIKEYRGRKVLIKFGGKAMQDQEMERSIANDLVMMRYVGLYPIVVHGGGPEISQYMKEHGLEPKFVDGLRVTDAKTMKIVKRVLVSKINKEITGNINIHGELATSVVGDDSELITAEKMKHPTVDLGFVGTVKDIKTSVIEDIVKEEKIPVIASIGKDANGNSYNINADSVASALAAALGCEKIIFLTNVDGIYGNLGDDKSLISALDYNDSKQLIDKKSVMKGMLPKVLSSMRALENGVHRAHILNGTIKHALLLEIFTDEGIGTMITA